MNMYNNYKIEELVRDRKEETSLLMQSKRKQIRFNKWRDLVNR